MGSVARRQVASSTAAAPCGNVFTNAKAGMESCDLNRVQQVVDQAQQQGGSFAANQHRVNQKLAVRINKMVELKARLTAAQLRQAELKCVQRIAGNQNASTE